MAAHDEGHKLPGGWGRLAESLSVRGVRTVNPGATPAPADGETAESPAPPCPAVRLAGTGMFTAPLWTLREPGLDASERLVLFFFFSAAGADGGPAPTVAEIATVSGLCRRTVQRAMKALEDKGILRVTRRTAPDGTQLANFYEIMGPAGRS